MLGRSPVATRPTSLPRRVLALILGAAIIGVAGVAAPQPASAAPKVVIVVGPSGGSTSKYITWARGYASQARSYGAAVVELYTPYATWDRVRTNAQGAKILIYLGHGNGWPSPYSPYNGTTKNGLGLNPDSGAGAGSPVRYIGESIIASSIRLAPGAIVLLNHLCYASGNSEPGHAEPTWSVAQQRVDNYGAGFIGAGAGAVLADAHTDLGYELAVALKSDRNLLAAWRADPNAKGHERSFASARRPGFTAYMDPDNANSGFYRSLVTTPTFSTQSGSAAAVAGSPLVGKTTTSLILRSSPSTSSTKLASLATGVAVTVTGRLVADAQGRTWAPVRTSSGATGWMAGWYLRYTGSARPTTSVIVRSTPSTTGTKLTAVAAGQRVAVVWSTSDAANRVWLNVRLGDGRTGWMAGWYMQP